MYLTHCVSFGSIRDSKELASMSGKGRVVISGLAEPANRFQSRRQLSSPLDNVRKKKYVLSIPTSPPQKLSRQDGRLIRSTKVLWAQHIHTYNITAFNSVGTPANLKH